MNYTGRFPVHAVQVAHACQVLHMRFGIPTHTHIHTPTRSISHQGPLIVILYFLALLPIFYLFFLILFLLKFYLPKNIMINRTLCNFGHFGIVTERLRVMLYLCNCRWLQDFRDRLSFNAEIQIIFGTVWEMPDHFWTSVPRFNLCSIYCNETPNAADTIFFGQFQIRTLNKTSGSNYIFELLTNLQCSFS